MIPPKPSGDTQTQLASADKHSDLHYLPHKLEGVNTLSNQAPGSISLPAKWWSVKLYL